MPARFSPSSSAKLGGSQAAAVIKRFLKPTTPPCSDPGNDVAGEFVRRLPMLMAFLGNEVTVRWRGPAVLPDTLRVPLIGGFSGRAVGKGRGGSLTSRDDWLTASC